MITKSGMRVVSQYLAKEQENFEPTGVRLTPEQPGKVKWA
jgi:hypothetical protein